jgi:hypothetical protein
LDGLIEQIILLSLAVAVLFYMMAYVIIPSFNVTYVSTVTGLSTSLLQGLFFILFIVIIFAFVLLVIYTALGRKQ